MTAVLYDVFIVNLCRQVFSRYEWEADFCQYVLLVLKSCCLIMFQPSDCSIIHLNDRYTVISIGSWFSILDIFYLCKMKSYLIFTFDGQLVSAQKVSDCIMVQ